MGNKQNDSKKTIEKNNIKNQNIYLLCPNCFKKVPILNTFIEGETIKIKISCSCIEKNNFLIMNLIDYLSVINVFTNSNVCLFHPKILSKKFCLNCESWLCNECFSNHSIDICKKEYSKNNINEDNIEFFCKKHNNKKIYLCKKCLIIFCKTCFVQHNSRKRESHKGANIETYLTEQKVKAKYNKYQLYDNQITELKNAMKDELLKDIIKDKKSDENDAKKYMISFQENYLIHKTINEQLILLFELILKNCEYLKNDFILNKKFIINVIINTKINKIYPKLDKSIPLIEQMKNLNNFFKTNFINKKQEYNLNLINKIEKPNSVIEKMLSLPDNKFVIVNKDCEIKIYKLNNDKNKAFENIFTLNEHTNNITCIIPLRNKKYFATASDDCSIKIWDSELGLCTRTIPIDGKPFLIFENYGKINQIGCVPNRNSLTIFEYEEKNQNILFNISLEKIIPWIEGLYQFPNDGRIIISSSGCFDIFSSELKNIQRIYIANSIPQNFLQIKNEDLLVGLPSKEIYVYDKNLNFKKKLIGHKKNITSFLQLDDNKLLTSSLDSNIILWRIEDYEILFEFINNSFGINSMIIINEYRIITCSFYKTNFIEEWKLEKN